MKKPDYLMAWENKLKSTLENFKSKEDFKEYFKEEIVEGKDPYYFQSPRGDGFPGEGISCLFNFLKKQNDKKSLEKMDVFLEAIVETILDERTFHTPEKYDSTLLFGNSLYAVTKPVPKNQSLAEKVLPHILIEDIINGRINENSPNYRYQNHLVGLYFDLSPSEKYDFGLANKLAENLPFSVILFYATVKVDKEKAKKIFKNFAQYEIRQGGREIAEWRRNTHYPKDKEIAEFLRGLK